MPWWQEVRADRQRGGFCAVHCAPGSSSDVPDEMEARLVILGPETAHSTKNPDSAARLRAEEILTNRGKSPRIYKNMLVFLAPDKTRLGDLEQAIRNYLAWASIWDDKENLSLFASPKGQPGSDRGNSGRRAIHHMGRPFCLCRRLG